MTMRYLKLVIVLLAALCVARPAVAQAPGAKAPEWYAKLTDLMKEKKFDEALTLVRAKAAENPPHVEVPQAMLRLAQGLYYGEKFDESLALHIEITERFPKSPAAALAWCQLGAIHGRFGEYDKMIAALERGVAAAPAVPEIHLMDNGDARQVLGAHYVKERQWEKALKCYSDWKFNAAGWACSPSMQADRSNYILLCLVQLGRFDEATREAWTGVVASGSYGDGLAAFVLVRLYHEAGQLNELRSLADEALDMARARFKGRPAAEVEHLIADVKNPIDNLVKSIALAESKRFSDHVAVFQNSSDYSQRHVAAWVLIREHKLAIQPLLLGARKGGAATNVLIEIIAAIDSPAADAALASLARPARSGHRNNEFAAYMIQERKARAKGEPIHPDVESGEVGLPMEFYKSWPVVSAGALPTKLPADLFGDRRK